MQSKSQNSVFRSTYLLIFEGQNSLCEYYFVLGINRALLSIIKLFFHVSSPSGKGASHDPPPPPLPSEISAFEPPFSLGISSDLPWEGGGMDIFWNQTFHKTKITGQLEDMHFTFLRLKAKFTHSLHLFVKYFYHSKIKFISSRHLVISS